MDEFQTGNIIKKWTGLTSWRSFASAVIILIAGVSIGVILSKHHYSAQEASLLKQFRPIRIQGSSYNFINPLLGYQTPESIEFGSYKPLETRVTDFINQAKTQGQVTDISVYFRDLNLGRWVGINENQQYAPASMLKVVIMIAYYKQAENNQSLLNQQLLYSKSMDDSVQDVPYQAPSALQVGKSYTIEQLIEAMIINSDNGAKNLLLGNLTDQSLTEVYSDLGIENPDNNPNNYVISAKTYSVFFRILYNATYLNPNMSEKALNLLSQAKYNDGLVAGIPSSVKIAQKFGEHINSDNKGQATSMELHNCGIIYAPGSPYVLCVMTKGGLDISKLASVLKGQH